MEKENTGFEKITTQKNQEFLIASETILNALFEMNMKCFTFRFEQTSSIFKQKLSFSETSAYNSFK
ncbi:hypothetical protein T01_6477 [Trichinella spiralis]|uniref:Uncharacterized protein n=1 Tax=Trichinella spiralis TaxID=6334 RepID=A0A0V1BT47_TRISP|nr:hypothetical protein T01_6477 [Trichinella spiralis]